MDKKDKIIAASIKVFKKKGIEDAKVSDIVKEAGIAQGTFYLYFPSKLSVMPEISKKMLSAILKGLNKEVKADLPFAVQLGQIISVFYDAIQKNSDIFTFIYTGITQSKAVREWEAVYAPLYAWMQNFLARHQAQGAVCRKLDARLSAMMITAFIESTAEQVLMFNRADTSSIQRHRDELLSLIKAALAVK